MKCVIWAIGCVRPQRFILKFLMSGVKFYVNGKNLLRKVFMAS